jgi:hypothetical protein
MPAASAVQACFWVQLGLVVLCDTGRGQHGGVVRIGPSCRALSWHDPTPFCRFWLRALLAPTIIHFCAERNNKKSFSRLNSPIRHCEARSKLPCNSVRKSCQRLNRQMGAFALCIVQSIRLVQQHDGSMLHKVCDMTRSGAAACTFTSSQREQRNGNEFVVRRLISYPYSTLNKTIRVRL